ncbi:E3 ubiquitin-protein ligase TRIM71-like isoform X1 [Oopsacas minuta]|uniref:E3 ubiquitin-protein ligase TRIM71-like isoform X1 n=1 Tax=Oopsacas minuta TaxID=111878 RepID=A0AAV7JPE4_9METZ|nr:E3 ubiquitin-protein ligase TRIM71-like isoform X1 [Oopsacas minuta]
MVTRIFEVPPTESQGITNKIADSKRQQYFNDVTFTCQFCQESVKRATFLSCLHSFCKTCIDEKVKQEGTESIQCPLCPSYEYVSLELQSNPLPDLINKLKQLKTTKNLRCTDCVFGDTGETAVAYCVDCKATICKIDMKSHEKYNIGHLILQLHTLQDSSAQDILTSLQATTTGELDDGIGARYKLTEEYLHPYSEGINITSSTNELQEECIQETNSCICQLEDRKSNLEKKWNTQTTQVLTFFQQLYNQLEVRQAVLLEELTHKYQTLITPLEDAIQQLEQTVAYTGYVGVLSMYSYVTGISNRPVDKLQDISIYLKDFNLPDLYNVNVNHQTEQSIEESVNEFLTVGKVNNPEIQKEPTFVAKKHKSYKLGQKSQIAVYSNSPLDVAYDSNTKIFYALFRTHWLTYQQIHTSLKVKQRIRTTGLFQLNSSLALLNNSVMIISNQVLNVYSEKGKVLNQIPIGNEIGTIPNAKLYTFSGINSVYISCIESSTIYKVNYQTGVNEGTINLNTNIQQNRVNSRYAGTGVHNANFLDMVRSTTQPNQLLILQTANSPKNTTNNQYSIQIFDVNNLQYAGWYILSQCMSPFCCMTTFIDTLYVLDVSTGSVHKYKLDQIETNVQYNSDGGFGSSQANSQLNSLSLNSITKCTDIEGKTLKDTMIRAFSDNTKNQIMILSSGELHFIT